MQPIREVLMINTNILILMYVFIISVLQLNYIFKAVFPLEAENQNM